MCDTTLLISCSCLCAEFVHASDGDANGLIYWLGTDNGRSVWKNPADSGKVRLASGQDVPIGALSSLISRGEDFVKCDSWDAWCGVDLGALLYIRPTRYALNRHVMRDWQLKASVDGTNWTVISNHVNNSASSSWTLNCNNYYRFFVVQQTGTNSNGFYDMYLRGFEIYGTLRSFEQ